jgi:hypothetical protein
MYMRRIHAPPCKDFDAHVYAAVEELGDIQIGLMDFVDQVVADWAEERQLADGGDPALIEYNAQVEAELMYGIDHWRIA